MNARLLKFLLLGLAAIAVGTAASRAASDAEASYIRYDGLYRAHPGGGAQTLFLRFYPDGFVIVRSFMGSPKAAAEIMNKSHEALPNAHYVVTGDNFLFTTHSARGDIEYTGKRVGDLLVIHIHSKITEFVADEPFGFVKVTFPDHDNDSK